MPVQLELFPEPDGEDHRPAAADPADGDLYQRLAGLLGGRLTTLTLTDNRSTILSARAAAGGGLRLRLHRSFTDDPDEVLRQVAAFALGTGRDRARRRQALAAIRDHFARHREEPLPPPRSRRRPVLRPAGKNHDLAEIRDALNRAWFDGRLAVDITWGRAASGAGWRRSRRRGRASIQLGTYIHEDNLVRIHRALDHPSVPRYVVEAVVYHELLHAAMPPTETGGRRTLHPPEFRARERRFPTYARAERWIARHLGELLARR